MNIQSKALTATHKTLSGISYPSVAKAQEAVTAAILASVEGDNERVAVNGDEQGVKATMRVICDPTSGEGDAFGFEYIGTLGPDGWVFLYSGPFDVTDAR